jgi:putative radical SAM enzyme (TIGR03279 family)
MSLSINYIKEGSAAESLGLKRGDVILAVNNEPVIDIIDYMFYSSGQSLDINVLRNDKKLKFTVKKKDISGNDVELKAFRTKSCRNKCLFCFVNQLPKGMRKSLYLKDDDYRMSFLNGNYITLTNLSKKDKERIIRQKLGPLYVSVHTTNNDLRRKMLGNKKAPDIIEEIRFFTSHRIRFHAQIVVCPGLNDGAELVSTIKELSRFYPYMQSISVVPVGLTKHKRKQVRPVEKNDALAIIDEVKKLQRRFKKRHGDILVYLADELYIKAGVPFPTLISYGELPQLENGVGMVPLFMSMAKKTRLPKKIEPKKIATFTGASFMPYLKEFKKKLDQIDGLKMELFEIENRHFGPSVTVAGLLTGKDILKTIVGKTKADCILVPKVTLREGSNIFLDNVKLKDIEETLGIPVRPIESTPQGLIEGIKHECKWED